MTTRRPAARRSTRASTAFDRADYERSATDFLAERGAAMFAMLSGQDEAPDTASIYERHAALFDQPAIEALANAAAGDGEEAREARALLGFATEGRLEREVAAISDQIATAEAQATIIWRGEPIPYRAATVRVAQISGRAERNGLMESYLEAVEAINPLRIERRARMRAALEQLGYADELDYASRLQGIDVEALARDMQQFLLESETVYYAALRRNLAEIDIEQGDASSADLDYILRGSGWDAWFEPRRLMETLGSTLAGLGIRLAEQRNVTLDFEARPGKSPRAFCVPVRVPQDVRLGVLPRGGQHDYASALHEAGHLEHFAHVDPGLPLAWRAFGDNSVTEGYAMLLHYLMLEPRWLAEHLGMREPEITGWADFFALHKLATMRRYAAKLLYEIRLHRGAGVDEGRAYYAGLLGSISGVRVPQELFLADVDDHFYAAILLRAWMVEGSLRAAMADRHGETWWRTTEAGDTLRRSWSRGQEWDAEHVVAHLGYDHLDWRPVLRQIRTRLIGEMSGYGGPNITTRAGTRKV